MKKILEKAVTEGTTSVTGNTETVKSPIDIVKEPFEKSLIKIEERAKNASFIEDIYFNLPPEYRKPNKNKGLVDINNSTFIYTSTEKGFKFNKKTNYRVKSASSVTKKYNNKSGKSDEVYYSITVITDKGKEIKDIEIKGKAKFNADSYQEALSDADNYLQTAFSNKPEFKAYLETLVLSKIKTRLIIYENSGLIEPQKFLGADFLIDKGNIYKANENGLIPTSEPDLFVIANHNRSYLLPRMSDSKKPVNQISADFLMNTKLCYGKNSTSALLAIGHMVMGLFFRQFLEKRVGVPLLIVCGVSSSGKTTLIQCGVSIFGMGDDFLIAGDSTVNGQQYIAQSINSVACPVDDVFDAVLKSEKFKAKIKANYRGTPRVRMRSYGTEPDLIHICSQILYTANGALPEVAEIENRANVISIMDTSLDVDKYNYLDENIENREELSLLLPELLKYSPDDVIEIHRGLKDLLKSVFDKKVNNRIPSNVAYMWTGLTLLQNIAKTTLSGIDDEIISYTKEVAEHYKKLPTPIDMLLDGLLVMKNMGIIEKSKHYDIKEAHETEDGKVWLMFHKDTMLTAYNNFFSKNPERKIEKSVFNRYLAVDRRNIKKNGFSHRYLEDNGKKGKNINSVLLDISNWADVEDFIGTYNILPTSYAEAKENLESSNIT